MVLLGSNYLKITRKNIQVWPILEVFVPDQQCKAPTVRFLAVRLLAMIVLAIIIICHEECMDNMLKPEQVAERLNCKPSSIYAWASTGKLPSYKMGGLLRFDAGEVEEWIRNHRVEPVTIAIPEGRKVNDKQVDSLVHSAIASVTGTRYNNPHKGKPGQSSLKKGG